MSDDTRRRILATVRDSLLRATLPDSSPDASAPSSRPDAAVADREALAAAFTAALTALQGQVRRAASPADAARAVVEIAAAHGARTVISWDERALECPGVLLALAAAGVARVTYDLPAEPAARDAVMQTLGAVPLGLTGADAALADTGALVLAAGPGRGRLCSMLPPVHVALVPVSRLVPDFSTWLAERPGRFDDASNVVVIAGPSRTADIEMTLTHGVHGPRHVHVVLIG